MTIFKLPDLGEGLPDAVIREWYIAEGDTVIVDQPMVAMETAKALVDVPVPFAGIIETLHGEPGDTIDTGHPLVTFKGTKNKPETAESSDAGTVVGDIQSSDRVIASTKDSLTANKSTASHCADTTLATPRVRVLAQELGVNLNKIKPAGAHITTEDVKKAANLNNKKQHSSEKELPGTAVSLSPVRKAMLMSMERSRAEIVPVTLADDAPIQSWFGKKDVTVTILKALAAACKAEPTMNAFFSAEKQKIYLQEKINIGLAVDTPDGLFVPVLQDVDNKSETELREEINKLKTYAKSRSFPPEMLKGATIILSNFGTFAGKYANPVLVPPLVTIVGIGKARDEVIPVEGAPAIAKVLPISVTSDHRAATGGEISRFLASMIEHLK